MEEIKEQRELTEHEKVISMAMISQLSLIMKSETNATELIEFKVGGYQLKISIKKKVRAKSGQKKLW